MAATVIAGTPLAMKPMPGPEPSEKSIELATMACCSLASPPKAIDSTVEAVLGPNALLGADLDRREGKSGGGRLADADQVGRACAPRTGDGRCRQQGGDRCSTHHHGITRHLVARDSSKLCRWVESIAALKKYDTKGACSDISIRKR